MEVHFEEIRTEFEQTFRYIRNDIKAILDENPNLHYTVALLICCACEMLAYHKNLEPHQVFTSLLPDGEPYPIIGKTMFEALRNGLAHRFRPETIEIGSHQWRFSIRHQGPLVSVTERELKWLQLNVKLLNERLTVKIDAYEEELRQSGRARFKFWEKSRGSIKIIPRGNRVAEAWKSVLGGQLL